MHRSNPPVVLIVRDGWGTNPHPEHDAFNAVKLAHTPVADRLMADWPSTHVITCGEDVGLPAGTMGNSEVGHQNIGAGRVVDQEIMRITRSIRDGSFFANEAFLAALRHARGTGGAGGDGSKLHLLGLLSDGKVHSDIEHLYALLELLKRHDFPGERAFIHVITDGRDVGPTTGLRFVEELESQLAATFPDAQRRPRIVSVCGRYYAMDRDHRWERIAQAYAMLTGREVGHPSLQGSASAIRREAGPVAAVQRYYDQPTEESRRGDEFIVPTGIVDPSDDQPLGLIADGDSVIFFNFRGDRPRELTKAFVLDDGAWQVVPNAIEGVGGFDRGERIRNLFFCALTGYEKGLPVSAIAFQKPPKMKSILGEVVSAAGLVQFRCAETEKFPHVTFFFNDYREEPFENERRELIPSPREVATYDQRPEMSALGVRDAVLRRLRAGDCESLIIVNFANPDMVGHTGNLQAAIAAVEVVDACVGEIVDAALARAGGAGLIVTADHGNAEQMWNPQTNSPHTAHTTYDVPLILVGEAYRGRRLRTGGRLADIAPTIMAMMGMQQPSEVTGESLLGSRA